MINFNVAHVGGVKISANLSYTSIDELIKYSSLMAVRKQTVLNAKR